MNSQHFPSFIGTIGVIGTFTLADINQVIGIAVGIFTLLYLGIRIKKELKEKNGK